MKGKSKRIVSGFLSALTIISSIMQPVTTYAAEAEPAAYEAEYPDMEKVKGALAEDEIVTAEDYEVEAGTGFDVKSDFSGMKIHGDLSGGYLRTDEGRDEKDTSVFEA